jgi:hypothetical protein
MACLRADSSARAQSLLWFYLVASGCFSDFTSLHSRDSLCNTAAGPTGDLEVPSSAEMSNTANPQRVGVALIGSQFISSIHAEALRACSEADVRAVASPTTGNAAAFAQQHGIPQHFTDYRALLDLPDVDMVVVGAPNDLHCQIALDAAAAGKHVVMEKPLCLNLAEADRMIEACRRAKVKLMYAEELCFAPK